MFNQPECASTRFMQRIPLETGRYRVPADILNTKCFCELGAVQLGSRKSAHSGHSVAFVWNLPGFLAQRFLIKRHVALGLLNGNTIPESSESRLHRTTFRLAEP